MVLHFSKVAITLNVTIHERELEQHIAATPAIVGTELAEQVMAYEHQYKLGYYPAIDYFQQQGGVDAELINTLQGISWVATNLVRNEITTRMRPVFSTIQFEGIQTLAYTLPSIRPGQPNARHKLINHYSAMVVKVNLVATMIQRVENAESSEQMAKSMCYRWLKEHFKAIEVTSASAM